MSEGGREGETVTGRENRAEAEREGENAALLEYQIEIIFLDIGYGTTVI